VLLQIIATGKPPIFLQSAVVQNYLNELKLPPIFLHTQKKGGRYHPFSIRKKVVTGFGKCTGFNTFIAADGSAATNFLKYPIFHV